MKSEIDARGLACPQPVVLAKNKMKDCSEIEIIVDNETARENIKRLASTAGWSYKDSVSGDSFKILLKKGDSQSTEAVQLMTTSCGGTGTVVVFASDKMGNGSDDLGAILMKAFIHTLTSIEPAPAKLLFYNSGVNLTADDSGVIDDLQEMQSKGVEILICGTCVNFYSIGDRIKTGTISNMLDILNSMNSSSRIIRP